MFSTRTLSRLALLATVAVGFACGDDNPTGPGSVTFPDWPSTVVAAFCVRGTAVVGDTKSSTISDTDCDAADVDPAAEGYFEVWRVRVASSRDVTFDANSTFDNVLQVIRVNSVSATNIDAVSIGANDDRPGGTSTNALVTVRLEPNIDYAVAISGFDYLETGPYTLAIR
jgi:hypothetical protein